MKYIVLCSGGKDSTASLLLMLERHRKKDIIPVYCDTGFDHSLTYSYLDYLEKKLNIDIIRIKSKKYKDLIDCVYRKKMFPSGVRRFCTENMKQIPLKIFMKENNYLSENVLIIMGIRKSESRQRAKRYDKYNDSHYNLYDLFSIFTKKNKAKIQFPIIDWNVKQVYKYICKKGLYINPLYDRGHSRVGCYPCIISGLKDYKLCWDVPEGKENIKKLFKLEVELNKMKGKINSIKIKPNIDRFQLKKIFKMKDDQLELFDNEKIIECGFCQL